MTHASLGHLRLLGLKREIFTVETVKGQTMATIKGKILQVDLDNKTVLMKTGISDNTDAGKAAGWDPDEEVMTYVQIDYSTADEDFVYRQAASSQRIDVRRAHLIPMGPEKCRETSFDNPFVVSAELAGITGRAKSQKLEDKSVEQLEAEIAKRMEEIQRRKLAEAQAKEERPPVGDIEEAAA